MARSLGTLTLDLIAKTGGFESGMDRAARIADKKTREIERQAAARAKAIEAAFAKMATGVAAAWGALNLVASVKGAADLADQLSKLSQRTGVAVKDLSALNYAAGLNDATLDDLGNGLKGLANKMLAAQSGSAEAVSAFQALGVKVTESTGKLRPVESVLFDIADAFSNMEDGAGKAAIANKLMEESGIRLIPTLNNGRAGLEVMGKEAEALGGIIRDDLAQASVQLNDNLARMDTIAQGLAASIGNAVIPSINGLATEFLNARRAGLSFTEALVGIGLSDPTKSPAEHIAQLVEELDKLENGKWFERSLFGNLAKDQTIEQKRKELEYWRLMLLEGDNRDPLERRAPPKLNAAPSLPTPTSKPSKPAATTPGEKAYVDPLTDAARAYESALTALSRRQLDAATAGTDLTASQSELLRLFQSPEWLNMPETWRVAVAEQGAFVIEAERAAKEQERLNQLLAATPTAQLEAQRNTMQFLAAAFEQGRISAQQFSEAASAALGNVPAAAEPAKASFGDLTDVANDAARNMAGVFADFFTSTDKNIGDMLESFLEATAKMIMQAMMLQAIQAGMTAMGVPMKFAKGGVFEGGVKAFADGGVVNSPTFFKFADGGGFKNGLMGEAGPEAILPLKRSADGKLGVAMNGSSGTNVNIAIHEAPGTKANVQQSQDSQGNLTLDIIIDQIEGKMSQNIARGRSPISQVMERQYGLNRANGAMR